MALINLSLLGRNSTSLKTRDKSVNIISSNLVFKSVREPFLENLLFISSLMKSTVYGAKQMPLQLFEDVKYKVVTSLLRPQLCALGENTSPLHQIPVLLHKQTFRSVQDVFALRIYYFSYPVSAAACHVYG